MLALRERFGIDESGIDITCAILCECYQQEEYLHVLVILAEIQTRKKPISPGLIHSERKNLFHTLADQIAAVFLVGAIDVFDQPVLEKFCRVAHRRVMILFILGQHFFNFFEHLLML